MARSVQQWHSAVWSALVVAGVGLAVMAVIVELGVGGVAASASIALVGALVVSAASVRVARDAVVLWAARRFWRQLAIAAGLSAAGLAVEVSGALGGPHALAGSARPVALVLYGAAALVLLWALLVIPTRHCTPMQWALGGLDAGTVLVTLWLYMWHFPLRGAMSAPQDSPHVVPLISATVVAIVGSVAVVRICLAGERSCHRSALALLGAGVLVGLAASVLAAMVDGDGDQPVGVWVAVTSAVWVCTAARYARAAATPLMGSVAAGRWLVLLPGGAAIAACGLLLVAGPDSSAEGRIVVGTSVVIGLMITARLLLALRDNNRLLIRVEAKRLRLDHYEQRFTSLLENATDIVLVTAPTGEVKYASPALQEVVGIPLDRLLREVLSVRVHPDDLAEVKRVTAALIADTQLVLSYQLRILHADLTWRWLEIVSRNLLNDPAVQGIVSNARDVTVTRRSRDQLAYLATHDKLTGLPNRSLLLSRTAEALAAAVDGAHVGLALLDIDDFKTINDVLGHGTGDDVILGVSNALVRCLGTETTIARLGGDEYAVLLDSSPAQMQRDLLRLLNDLDEPLTALGHDLLIRLNVGLAYGNAGMQASELMRRADVALSSAKTQDNGQHVTYGAELDRRMIAHARIGAELRAALKAGDQLHLLYQPIVTLPHGQVRSVEALVRWWHPQEGVMAPADFIPVAEQNGLIIPLGRWVLSTACAQAAAWAADPTVDMTPMSVNVSARQLREPDFPDDVAAIIRESGLDPALLIIEVTETAVFDSERAMQTLRDVRALGIRIALDDFGTGHSSLGLLRTCPVDIIKVDKTFIDDITGTAEQSAIAVSLLHITRAMELTAVAEGVESAEQAERLHQLGYEFAQGFHFAVPMPAEEIHRLLTTPHGAGSVQQPPRHPAIV
jgi:diguanylate cyclase (GGDEF)-like protein/PAS domain S-box-containing protein